MKVKVTISLLAGALLVVGGGTASAATLSSPAPAASASSSPAEGDTDSGTDGPDTPTDGINSDVTWGG